MLAVHIRCRAMPSISAPSTNFLRRKEKRHLLLARRPAPHGTADRRLDDLRQARVAAAQHGADIGRVAAETARPRPHPRARSSRPARRAVRAAPPGSTRIGERLAGMLDQPCQLAGEVLRAHPHGLAGDAEHLRTLSAKPPSSNEGS